MIFKFSHIFSVLDILFQLLSTKSIMLSTVSTFLSSISPPNAQKQALSIILQLSEAVFWAILNKRRLMPAVFSFSNLCFRTSSNLCVSCFCLYPLGICLSVVRRTRLSLAPSSYLLYFGHTLDA